MGKTKTNDSKYLLLLIFAMGTYGCDGPSKKTTTESMGKVAFDASDKELARAFEWAKTTALSYAHDNSDPVGYWYEAALPNREAFCMRDVSHQAIGAEILGLGKHNFNMLLKFAQNISEEKEFCTYWEINRYDKAAPVDYENDHDFWYNLPANFDVTYSAYRIYKWTGNAAYLQNTDLKKFYELSMNDYVDHWDLGFDQILDRDRSMHLKAGPNSRFGSNRGIPTYNEGGRGETFLGIDMTASIIAAYNAYSEMLKLNGAVDEAERHHRKAERELEFLNDFWWDGEKGEYRSILYANGEFDYFMVGEDQAFLHYLNYFDVISDDEKLEYIVDQYQANFDKLIVELKSYLPIIFYENGRSKLANAMIVDLCSPENPRRDYPENSFTVIEHLARGLMGINVDGASQMFSTQSRLEKEGDWAEMKNIPLLSNKVGIAHHGTSKTVASNQSGGTLKWLAKISGSHAFLYVNGNKTKCDVNASGKFAYSYCTVELREGEEVTVSAVP